MTQRQITIAIPDSIEIPAFKLFDRVRIQHTSQKLHRGHDRNWIGTIVAMDYYSFPAALRDYSGMGWQYTVDWCINASTSQALSAIETRDDYDAEDLELVEVL